METKKIEDYHFAKEELRMRLQLMYTQNMGVITAALALWTISIAAMKLLPDHEIGNSALSILIYMIFAIPAFIALPLSVKSGDNLSRVEENFLSMKVRLRQADKCKGQKRKAISFSFGCLIANL